MTSAIYASGIFWAFATPIIIAVTVVAYARLGLFSRADLAEISRAFVSAEQLDQVYPYARYILRVLYGE